MPINWGIAAAGRITNDFVKALQTIPGNHHHVVAVADLDYQRAEDFAKTYGVKNYYGSFELLAEDPNVDIVYIGTLNVFHFSVAKLMLQKGKNVLCEKPICLHYSYASELYDLAFSQNVFLMEAMWSRCFPSYSHLRELLTKKVIGEVQEVHVQHGFNAQGVERIATRNLGGGITLDIGIYGIQLGQLLFIKYPEKITATGSLNHEGVDVESEIILDYGNNKKLFVKVSALQNYDNKAIIKGDQGQIIMENYWCCTKIIEADGKVKEWKLPEGNLKFNHTNACGLRYEAEVVRKCLEQGLKECPLYTHANSLEMVKIEAEVLKQLRIQYD